MRPIDGHEDAGEEAFVQGEMSCPWQRGSVAAASWRLGWTKGAEEAGMLEDEDDVHRARADLSFLIARIRAYLPAIHEVEKAIGEPSTAWPRRCHEIATAVAGSGLLSHMEGEHGTIRIAYGAYRGPVAAASPFAGRPVSRHGWLETASGLVIDATRWVFTDTPPALWVGTTTDYDLGSIALRERFRTAPPRPTGGESPIDIAELTPEIRERLGRRLGDRESLLADEPMSREAAFWLATEAPQRLGWETAEALHGLLRGKGMGGLIPVDFATVMALADDLREAPAPTGGMLRR